MENVTDAYEQDRDKPHLSLQVLKLSIRPKLV